MPFLVLRKTLVHAGIQVVKAPDHLELIIVGGPAADGQKLLPPARFTATALTIGRTKVRFASGLGAASCWTKHAFST